MEDVRTYLGNYQETRSNADFEDVVWRCSRQIYEYVKVSLKVPVDDVPDVVQETLMKIMSRIKVFDREKSGFAWVKAIARDVVKDRAKYLRREQRGGGTQVRQPLRPTSLVDIREPQHEMMHVEQLAIVRDRVGKMGPAYLEVFNMKLDGYKPREIAKELGTTSQDVEVQLNFIRRRLTPNREALGLAYA